jgi:hypothetical protein
VAKRDLGCAAHRVSEEFSPFMVLLAPRFLFFFKTERNPVSLPINSRRRRRPAQVAASQPAPATTIKFLKSEPDRHAVATANAQSAFTEMARLSAAELREQIFNEGEWFQARQLRSSPRVSRI